MTEQATTLPDLSVKETAHLFSCSPKHIWVMIQEGALRTYKIGRISRVARESIEHLRQNGYDRHNPTA